MTEIPKPGTTETTLTPSTDSRFIFSGLPWLPVPRSSLPTPMEEKAPIKTPETIQPQPDLLSRYPWGTFSLIREIAHGKPNPLA